MFNQNYVADFVTKLSQPQQLMPDIKKVENNSKTSFPQFKDVLTSTVNKGTSKSYSEVSSTRHKDEQKDTQSKNIEHEQQPKSYREVALANKQETKADKVDSTAKTSEKPSLADDSVKETKQTKSKEDVVIDSLAQVFGMQVSDLVKMLNSLNIQPEDLTNESKINEVVDKLVSVMNLDDKQTHVLVDLIKVIKAKVDEAINETDEVAQSSKTYLDAKAKKGIEVLDSKESEGETKVNNVDVKVIEDIKKDPYFSEIMAKLKVKLDEITQKLQQNPEKFMNELSEKINEIVTKTDDLNVKGQDGKVKLNKTDTEVKNDDGILKVDGNTVKAGNAVKAENAETSNSKESENPESDTKEKLKPDGPQTIANINVKIVDESIASQSNNAIPNQLQKASGVNETSNVYKDVQVPKNEILSQVLEKAKVVLTGEKSEMVMDLKPDNLGKLALKVVTERGMVVAKFIVESQQVKETLEANMQILKDSLQKQGLTVQGFSVSVQQDSYKGYKGNREFNEGKNTDKSGISLTNAGMINVAEAPEKQIRSNPYSWSGSQINLTA